MKYHIRRSDKEITDKEIMKNVLKTTKYVTIALCMDNRPYLVTLSHGYDETHNCLYFHCAKEGKKIDYIRENNSVWGTAFIDSGYEYGKCNQLYTSVHFSGKIMFVEAIDEKSQALHFMIRQLEKDPEPLISKLKPERLAKVLIGRINIDYMSCKGPEKEKA